MSKNISKWERNEKKEEEEKTKKKMYDFRRKLEQKYLLYLTVNDCSWWIITECFDSEEKRWSMMKCCAGLNYCFFALYFWFLGCIPSPARTFIHYFRKNLGPYVGLPEERAVETSC
jgi:hypothetical protein